MTRVRTTVTGQKQADMITLSGAPPTPCTLVLPLHLGGMPPDR